MYLQDLSDKIWKTKNARFKAAQRMRRSRISSTASVALLSASVIAVNMLAFLNISDSDKTIITIVTVVLSTFALVMSLLIALLRYEYREDNYQQCGRELENLNQRLKIRINEIQAEKAGESDVKSPKDDDMQYLGEYNDILRRFNLNHSEFDYCYSLMKAENDKDHGIWLSFWYWVKWNLLDVSVLYWLIAILPIIAVFTAFSSILNTII